MSERSPVARLWSLLTRMGWGFGDQALSSLTNFALGMLVARAVDAEEFGAFSLAFSTYLLVMGVSRSVSSDPLVVRFSAAEAAERERAAAAAIGVAVAIGCVGAIGVLIASVIVQPNLAGALLALGLTLPGLITQDGWRYAFFAADQGSKAFVNDLVWTIALALFAGGILITDRASAFTLVLAWGAAATVAAVFGLAQSHIAPRPQTSLSWLRTHKDLAVPFLGQFGALIGGAQLAVYAIASIVGLAAAGAFRAAAILLGPVTMFYRGIRLTAVPDAVRIAKRAPHRLRGRVFALAGMLGGATLVWGVALQLVPDRLGTSILGDTWTGARSVLLPITLSVACGGVVSGLEMGLRALAAAKRSFRARLTLAPLTVAFTIVGALAGGAWGAAWGQVAGITIGMAIWTWHFVKALGEATPEVPTDVVAQTLEA